MHLRGLLALVLVAAVAAPSSARAMPPAHVAPSSAAHVAPSAPAHVAPPAPHAPTSHASVVSPADRALLDTLPTAPGGHLFQAIQKSAPRAQLLRATALDVRAAKGSFDAFAASRYGDAGPSTLARLRSIHPSFEELVVDPGTVSHLPELRSFLKFHPELTEDPWAARQALSTILGTRTVYRALALTPSKFAKIQAELDTRGIGSELKRHATPEAALSEPTIFLTHQVDKRVSGWGSFTDPLVSVATLPRVAASVAGAIASSLEAAPNGREKGYAVYVFTLKVPAIDIISERPSDPILAPNPANANQQLRLSWVDRNANPHTRVQPFASPDVESFVLFGVDGHEVTNVSKLAPSRAGTYSFEPPTGPAR